MEIGNFLQWGNVVILVATAVWAVSKIKMTTERLAISIEHLRATVNRLDNRFDDSSREVALIRDRLTILETKFSDYSGRG